MSADLDEKMKELDETMQKLNDVMDNRMNDAYTSLKKGVVQTVILAIVTIAIYFLWGTPWYFWVSLAISLLMLALVIFSAVLLGKAKKKMSDRS